MKTDQGCLCLSVACTKPIWTSRLEGRAPAFPSDSQLALSRLSHFDLNRWFSQRTIFIWYNAKLNLSQEPVDLCEQDVISLPSSPAVFNHFCRPSRGSQSKSTWPFPYFKIIRSFPNLLSTKSTSRHWLAVPQIFRHFCEISDTMALSLMLWNLSHCEGHPHWWK